MCTETEWKRAYREINQFEHQLIDFGSIIFKYWIHIGKDEQLRRFEERAGDELRSWKLTEADWHTREKWDLYEEAVNDMLVKTSTVAAPWTVVEGNSKYYARVKVLRTAVEKLAEELKTDPFKEVGIAGDGMKKAEKDKRKDKKK
jgi:polyphosphate kinase 2 (PPK2 family)